MKQVFLLKLLRCFHESVKLQVGAPLWSFPVLSFALFCLVSVRDVPTAQDVVRFPIMHRDVVFKAVCYANRVLCDVWDHCTQTHLPGKNEASREPFN